MVYEGDGSSAIVLLKRARRHYHGGEVRALFMVSAVMLLIAQSTGAVLPLSTPGAVILAVVLVIAAGITNPTIVWIHWADAGLAIISTVLFGTAAVAHYRTGGNPIDLSFVYTEALALLALAALYFTTRTIRGRLLHESPDGRAKQLLDR